jgi:putative peptidoglycan lipid II flippase
MSRPTGRGAVLVAAGILLSRVVGLLRQKLFAHFLGSGLAAAAFLAALRIPNFLQNLLGEGVLSASFIPVYAGLRARQDDDEADRVAGAVFGLLALVVALLVAAGIVAAPLLVRAIAPGYHGQVRALTVDLVRIFFPGIGMLVLSAWCLGVLNSHRRFFLSYAAPVVWNGCIIGALVLFGGRVGAEDLARRAAWGAVAGGVLQFLVQLPLVLRLLGRFRPAPSPTGETRVVIRNFLPAVAARGVVQISAFVDIIYASLLSGRAVAALGYAQTIAQLPVSLFGMAISAAELPEMSAAAARAGDPAAIRERLAAALPRLAFFVVPSATAFVLLGDLVSALLLQSGRFSARDSRLVWYILMGSAVGLLAQTMGRLYSSAFFALRDTRTPLKFAALRVVLAAGVGYFAARVLPGLLELPTEMGVGFLTATSGTFAWLEYALLRRALGRRVGDVGLPRAAWLRLQAIALGAAGLGLGAKMALTAALGADPAAAGEWGGTVLPPPAAFAHVAAVLGLCVYGVAYLGGAYALGVPQARNLLRRLRHGAKDATSSRLDR